MRQILEGPDFQQCVERLGGHRAIDLAMEPIIDGLMRNPFGFKYFENNWVKFRYARTKPIGGIVPGLIVVFSIDENKNVILN